MSDLHTKESIDKTIEILKEKGFTDKDVSNAFISLIMIKNTLNETERWGKRCIDIELPIEDAKKEIERHFSCCYQFLHCVYEGGTVSEFLSDMIESKNTSGFLYDVVYNLDTAFQMRIGTYNLPNQYLGFDKFFQLLQFDESFCKRILTQLKNGAIYEFAFGVNEISQFEFESDMVRKLRHGLKTYEQYLE